MSKQTLLAPYTGLFPSLSQKIWELRDKIPGATIKYSTYGEGKFRQVDSIKGKDWMIGYSYIQGRAPGSWGWNDTAGCNMVILVNSDQRGRIYTIWSDSRTMTAYDRVDKVEPGDPTWEKFVEKASPHESGYLDPEWNEITAKIPNPGEMSLGDLFSPREEIDRKHSLQSINGWALKGIYEAEIQEMMKRVIASVPE